MKANIKLSVILFGIAFAFSFSSCERIQFDEDENAIVRNARNTLQEYETDGGDFVFLKSLIGMEVTAYNDYLTANGYEECEYNNNLSAKYTDTRVDSISKYLFVHFGYDDRVPNVEMKLESSDIDTLSAIFKKWLLEILHSSSYPLLVRESYSMRNGNNGYQYVDTPEQILEALESVDPSSDNISFTFSANDSQAYKYSLHLRYGQWNPSVYMQIINERVNNPLPEVPTVNLTDEYLGKDILIAKVDYMSFEYGGFYSMNVTNKQNEGNEIPFLAEYMSPSDFGYIKLYYHDESNLLMDGSIIWAGCGALNFPETLMKRGLSFPSDRISYIDADGNYVQDVDESDNDLGYIWQTLSSQEEFMSYYEQTSKKVAVFLYQPSVGVGDPYDWYYMVFVER